MNDYLLIFFGIFFVLMLSNVAYGYNGDCDEYDSGWSPHYKILCYVSDILENQENIIEKLDWNNCAMWCVWVSLFIVGKILPH